MKFKELPNGLFRAINGVVYSKFSDTQAILITSGSLVDFKPEDEVMEDYNEINKN